MVLSPTVATEIRPLFISDNSDIFRIRWGASELDPSMNLSMALVSRESFTALVEKVLA